MKIQNIKTISFNQYQTQNKQKVKNNNNQKFSQIDKLSNKYYTPIFGQNKTVNAVEALLDDENFDVEQKYYLQFLTTIDDFPEAAKGMDKKTLQRFLMLAQEYRPVFEDVLKGNYVASYGKVNKPLIDLKSIADYNKKQANSPLNLFNCIFGDVVVFKFLHCMKALNRDKLNNPSSFEYEINGEPFKTTIKYQQKSISEEKINQLKNAPINPLIREYLSYKSTLPEVKQLMWELSEIPYFNSIIKDISFDELDLIIDLVQNNRIFITELLKGNICHFDKKTNKEKPLIDLKEAAINNYKENLSNQKNIFNLLLNNKSVLQVYQKTMNDKYANNRFPAFLYSNDMNANSKFISFTTDDNQQAERLLEELTKPHTPINHFIIFKNDLNEIAAKTDSLEFQMEEEEEDIILEKLVEEREIHKTPQVVLDYLKDSKIDNNLKKIVYDFAEEIPYFNYFMRDASMEDLKVLIELKNRNSKIFNMLMDGKIKLIKDEFFGECILPIIDVDEMVRKEGKFSSIIYKNSLVYDLTRFISEINEIFHVSSGTVSIDKNSTDCKSFLNYMEENNTDQIKIVLED